MRCRGSCPDGTWTGSVRGCQRVAGSKDRCNGILGPNESSPRDVDFLGDALRAFSSSERRGSSEYPWTIGVPRSRVAISFTQDR